MTDFKTSDRDVNRAIRSWLREDRHEDVSRIAGVVLDQVDTIPQRRATWLPARRTPVMNKIVGFGLAAAAVVAVLLIGSQLLGSPSGGVGGPGDEPAPTPGASVTEPSSSASVAWRPLSPVECAELEAGTYRAAIGASSVTASVPTGWSGGGDRDGFNVNSRGCLFAGGVTLDVSLVSHVYSSACDGQGTAVETGTPAAVTAALAAQTGHQTIGPIDTTIAGYPASRFEFSVPGDATTCNLGPLWLAPGRDDGPTMYVDGSGSFVTVYVVDVDGSALGIAVDSGVPDEPADVAELDAIVASLRIEP